MSGSNRFASLTRALLSRDSSNAASGAPDEDEALPGRDLESRRGKLTTKQILEKLRSVSRRRGEGPDALARKQKFLMRLAMVLHTYGSSATRTEFLVLQAAQRLGVAAHVAVFPTTLFISFSKQQGDDLGGQDTRILTASQDLDVDKLSRADELAATVGCEGNEFLVAYWRLAAIMNAPPEYGTPARLLAFVMMSASAAPLFFGGSSVDAAVSAVLGLVAGLLDLWAAHNPVAASAIEFISAIIIAASARLAYLYLTSICFYTTALASLVWYLPGLSLTVGVNELVAKTYVTGSSRITAAIFSALQIGFGMAIGTNLIFWKSGQMEGDCTAVTLSRWLEAFWLTVYVIASNILLYARWDQWLGMSIVAVVGYYVSLFTIAPFGDDASTVIAATAVGVAGTLFARIENQLPLALKTSGILILVPGGIGVKGIVSMMNDDVVSGLGFVFDMLVVGLSITLGLLLSKIFAWDALLMGHGRRLSLGKSRLQAQLKQDQEEVETHVGGGDDEEEDGANEGRLRHENSDGHMAF